MLDSVDLAVLELVGRETVRVYGLPGHLRTCLDCGRLNGECVCCICDPSWVDRDVVDADCPEHGVAAVARELADQGPS